MEPIGAGLRITARRRVGLGVRFSFGSNAGSAGSMTVREVLDGIRLVLLDMHSLGGSHLDELSRIMQGWGFVHCQHGSLACRAADSTATITPGDVVFLSCSDTELAVSLPQGKFRGLFLIVSEKELARESRLVMKSFFGIESSRLDELLSHGQHARVLAANLDASHVLSELYSVFTKADQSYLRLKCFELMMLYGYPSGLLQEEREPERDGALADRHVAIAYQAQAILTSDIARTPTIRQLAEECRTSPTVLKEAFRESFGVPVYSWVRAYRVRRACELMEEDPDRSIAGIAAEVGYANPSKFAKAFSDCMGTTPSVWREVRLRGKL